MHVKLLWRRRMNFPRHILPPAGIELFQSSTNVAPKIQTLQTESDDRRLNFHGELAQPSVFGPYQRMEMSKLTSRLSRFLPMPKRSDISALSEQPNSDIQELLFSGTLLNSGTLFGPVHIFVRC